MERRTGSLVPVVLSLIIGLSNAQKEGESIDPGNFVTYALVMPTIAVCVVFTAHSCYKRYKKRKRAHRRIKKQPVSNFYDGRISKVNIVT